MLLPFALAVAMASVASPPSQTECGLTLAEFNAVVEKLEESNSFAEYTNRLNRLPADIAECIEFVLDGEREFENARIAAEIRHERAQSPAAQAVATDYGVNPRDIAQVAWVQPLENGTPLEEIEIVTLDNGETYYYFPEDESTSDTEPPSLLWTNERRQRGTGITNVKGSCTGAEWVVRFPPLPTCFHQRDMKNLEMGYDGIDDAWASGPNCHFGCQPRCAWLACGSAWDGSGQKSWWSFKECSGRAHPEWTTDAGKMVQKRWYYSWHDCLNNKSDSEIANMVERLIHW